MSQEAWPVELGQRLVDPLDLEPERELEVLLVPDHDVDVRHQLPVHLRSAGRGRRSPPRATRGS